MFRKLLAVLALLTTFSSALDVHAESRGEDLDVLTRSLRFLLNPPQGLVDLAVVYDSTSPASLSDARDIVDLAKSRKGKGFTLMPRLIDQQTLDKLASADLVLLSAGSDDLHALVFAQARANEILVVSLHQSCIDLGLCVMWVKGVPDVRIVLNHAAAESVNARFSTTFRMMVQER